MSTRLSRLIVCTALSAVLQTEPTRAQLPYDAPSAPHDAPLGPSDAELRREMIEESIAAYVGACPCPYNRMRNGAACGVRSAYSKPGGRAPLCYETDISEGW